MKEKEINKVADKDELVQVLDENGNETNKLEQRKVVHDNGIWHNEVSCIVINNNKQILLQRRSANKKQYPSCWGLFAGHVVGYDSLIDAIITEMREELISEIKEENLFLLVPRMKNQRENNNCFVTCYCAVVNKPESEILFQREEIDEVKWFEFDEFKILVENEKGTIFKNNDYYKAIIAQLEKLFNNKDFYKKIDDLTEKLEELDRFGNPTGKIITREFAHNYGIYHKAVSLFLINDKKEILLQQRSLKKIRNAGLWDISVSGHVRFGEDEISALLRECQEETKYNLTEKDLKFLIRYKENRKFNEKFIDNTWFNVYLAHVHTKNEDVNDLEVSQTKFFSVEELKEKMKTYNDLAYKPQAFNEIIKYIERLK